MSLSRDCSHSPTHCLPPRDAGLKLALEIKSKAPGTLLKDFIATMESPVFQSKIAALREKVSAFALTFPLPIAPTFQ